jgi:hypothetical protein
MISPTLQKLPSFVKKTQGIFGINHSILFRPSLTLFFLYNTKPNTYMYNILRPMLEVALYLGIFEKDCSQMELQFIEPKHKKLTCGHQNEENVCTSKKA